MTRTHGPRSSRWKPRRPRTEPLEARALLTVGFDPTPLPSTGQGVAVVASADFTGDGVPDLVQADAVPEGRPSTLTVRVGRGDGSFGDPFVIAQTQERIWAIAPGDFNGDGLTDVAVVGQTELRSTIQVLLNQGNGVFSALPAEQTDSGIRIANAADLDGDGQLDLLAGTKIFRGNGDGTFRLQPTIVGNPYNTINDRVVADLNGDGRPDVVTAVANFGNADFQVDGRIEVRLNQADGTFGDPIAVPYDAATSRIPGRINADHLAVADFNGDGKPDLAVGDRAVRVLPGQGDGTFAAGPVYDIGRDPSNLVAGDFNGDGRLDLATIARSSGVASLILGNGDGTFQAGRFDGRRDLNDPSLLADVNGDGVPDLIGVLSIFDATASPNLTVRLGRGDGTLAPTTLTPLDPDTGGASNLASGDLNGDGFIDVVVLSNKRWIPGLGSSEYQPEQGRTVLLGRGDGTFTALPTGFRSGPLVGGVELVDVDGDGRLDLVEAGTQTTASDPQVVQISLGRGDGTFDAPTVIELGLKTVLGSAVGDLDNDGRPDLAVTDTTGNSVRVLLNQSTPGVVRFGPALALAVGDTPAQVEILDLDGDGRNDLAVLNRGTLVEGVPVNNNVVLFRNHSNVVLLRNLGDGTFGSPEVIDATPRYFDFYSTSLDQGDFNGDGRPDLMVRYAPNNNDQPGDIHVIAGLNQPGGVPVVSTTLVTQGTNLALVGDLDRDGHPDILTISYGDPVLYPNRGDGTFNQPLRFAVTPFAGPILAADVDGDGIPDLITFSPDSGTGTVLRNTTAQAARPFTVTRLSLPDLAPSDTAGEWTLAYLRDLDPQAQAGDYRVSVDWGDGSPTDTATLFSLDPGRFAIQGRHAYAQAGQYAVRVTVLNVPSNQSSNFLTPVTVTAGPIYGDPLPVPVDPPIILPPALPPPPVLTGGMDPRSDTGASATDRITRDNRPVFRGVADPGARIELFVHRIDPSGTIGEFTRVGTAQAGADGAWSVQASPLADGAYTVTVVVSPIGNVQTLITIAPAAQPLRIDTAGPTISEVVVGPRKGQVIVRFADAGGLALSGPARQAVLYRVGQGSLARRWAVTGAAALDAQTVRLTLRKGRAIPVGTRLAVRVDSGAIVDAAGNPLDPASRRAVKVRAGQVHPVMARRAGHRRSGRSLAIWRFFVTVSPNRLI